MPRCINAGPAIAITPWGEPTPILSPHSLYLALGEDDKTRQAAYRSLLRAELDKEAISDIRLALRQNQPLGNSRFYAKIEAISGRRREPKPRGGLKCSEKNRQRMTRSRVNCRFEPNTKNNSSLAS